MKFITILLILSFFLTGCSSLKNKKGKSENVNNSEAVRLSNYEPETTIASFSTKIYTKEENRQNNLKLACDKLNGTIVKSRRNFFFLQYFRPCKTRRRL